MLTRKEKAKKKFLEWVYDHFEPQELLEPPADFDPNREFYFRPDPSKPIHYGPIQFEDIPRRLLRMLDRKGKR